MDGQAACDLGREGSLGSSRARVPELDRGGESGSVIKCARAATQAGEPTSPGICRNTLLERMQVKQAAEDAQRIRTIFAQHDGEY